jgi:hypothetical protein
MTYNEFIQTILNTRGRHGVENEYYERHHILARCCGGTDEDDNLIDLFAEEHYTAHKLLADENPDIIGLQQAFACMSFMKKDHYRVTCEEYAVAKKAQSIASSARLIGVIPGIRKGIPCSEETKQKLREKNKQYKPTEEARRRQSEALKGRKVSEETKQKLHEALTGRTMSLESRTKMSISKIGNQNAKGHVLSDETKQQIQETKKRNGTNIWSEEHHEKIRLKQERGELHWTLLEETKNRISESRKGMVFSEEHKKHMSEAQKGKPKPSSKYKHTSEQCKKAWETRKANNTDVAANKGRLCITDGSKNRYILPEETLPEGWFYGSTQVNHVITYNKTWLNDGEYAYFIDNASVSEYLQKGYTMGKNKLKTKKTGVAAAYDVEEAQNLTDDILSEL